MDDDEAVNDSIGRVSTVVNKLCGLGKKVDEEYIVKKMLRVVLQKFIQIAFTIEEFGDSKSKTMEEVISSLKAHEERLHGRDMKGGEHVLLTHREWKARKNAMSPGA